MTEQQTGRLVPALRALAEDIRAEELAELPPAWAKAVLFYAASRGNVPEEERFLALYNGLGTLLGYTAAKAAVEQTVGSAEEVLRTVHGEGDCEGAPPRFHCGGTQLDALAALLRKALLAQSIS